MQLFYHSRQQINRFYSFSKMNYSTIGLTRTTAAATGAANAAVSSYALNGALFDAAPTSNAIGKNSVVAAMSSVQVNTMSTTTTTTTPNNCEAQSSSSNNNNSKQANLAAKIIQQSDVICFDVDSTVICEEGIDELANYCGKGSEVARITKQAMGGSMTFQDALKIRLNAIRPTQQQIAHFIRAHPSTLTKNVKAFVEHLKRNGKQIYLVSGGFDCLIEPVANELGIPMTNLFANKLMFYYNGDYANFDMTQPTSKTGGKAEAISIIRQKYNSDTLVTMIGDGATDLEAVPPANYFIGFGGNVQRAEVFKRAQYYVSDFQQLM